MALIMIVDDDAHIQLALRQIVESAGHSAIEAGNGQDAIEMFAEYRPDLVITDIFMPQIDGIEAIRAIRRCNPDAKIIAISGGYVGSGWNYLSSVVVLGADLALQKPFTVSQLTTSINLLLARPTPYVMAAPAAAVAVG
jgi:YesN/AraC family two-component response regulator